jgi:hypothetical protein
MDRFNGALSSDMIGDLSAQIYARYETSFPKRGTEDNPEDRGQAPYPGRR